MDSCVSINADSFHVLRIEKTPRLWWSISRSPIKTCWYTSATSKPFNRRSRRSKKRCEQFHRPQPPQGGAFSKLKGRSGEVKELVRPLFASLAGCHDEAIKSTAWSWPFVSKRLSWWISCRLEDTIKMYSLGSWDAYLILLLVHESFLCAMATNKANARSRSRYRNPKPARPAN